MLRDLVNKLKSDPKQIGYGVLAVVLLGVCVWLIAGSFGGDRPARESLRRTLICSETGEVFPRYTIERNSPTPFRNPKTGERTLYPAESCYWTEDGRAKAEPTFVLVNEHLGVDEPTYCPDCGRRVVPRNPMPPEELMLEAMRERYGDRGG